MDFNGFCKVKWGERLREGSFTRRRGDAEGTDLRFEVRNADTN